MRWFVTQSLVPLEIQCVNFSQHYALTTYLFDTNALLFWMKMVTHCVEFNFEKYQKSAFVTSTPWGFFVICQRDWMANTKGNIAGGTFLLVNVDVWRRRQPFSSCPISKQKVIIQKKIPLIFDLSSTSTLSYKRNRF